MFETGRRIGYDPEAAAAGEIPKRYFFHRLPVNGSFEARVMNDFAIPNVNAMVQVASTRRDDVGSQRGRLSCMPNLLL
jgi:hypothetical protein